MRTLYHGSELCEVDADGDVAIPSFLQEAFFPETNPEILVARHQTDHCLVGYGSGYLSVLAERAEHRRLAEEERGEEAQNHYRRMRSTFGVSERVTLKGGRLRLPPTMRHLGRIGELALFIGAGDSFEIWNPELALESDDEHFRALAEFRLRMRDRKTSKGVR